VYLNIDTSPRSGISLDVLVVDSSDSASTAAARSAGDSPSPVGATSLVADADGLKLINANSL
jgi:hypothetical protein